jgi:anti-sigma regulatory factor (Ser/Thr protein kinase)
LTDLESNEFAWLERPATMESFRELQAFVVEGARKARFPDEKLWKVELVVEELVTNVIRHGYPAGQIGKVTVGYHGKAGGPFRAKVRSGGAAFDPLARETPDLSKDIDERTPGGLGIHLVKNITDELAYERLDETNIVSFMFLP